MLDKKVYETYVRLLQDELTMATGCTEPIAIAYAGAVLRKTMGEIPQKLDVYCSGNIVKNVLAVTVPNSGGAKGIEAAAYLGAVGGNPERVLDVLGEVSEEDIGLTKRYVAEKRCIKHLATGVPNLYIRLEGEAGKNRASVEIQNYHTNIVRIEHNGTVLLDASKHIGKKREEPDRSLLNVKDILEFANTLELKDVHKTLLTQITCNKEIAEEGLKNDWGASVGKTIFESDDSLKAMAAAYAAAGSDARMNGCPLPVVINSGSGNQGIAVSMPLYVYARFYNIPEEKMLRSLALANLISLHQKRFIGSLSAYCGAVSAATAAACGIAYMLGYGYDVICGVITNSINTTGGIICDGAKSSCASKIAASVSMALLSLEMSIKNRVFLPGEGLVEDSLEKTIESVGRMGREGMKSTDLEILNIMLEK